MQHTRRMRIAKLQCQPIHALLCAILHVLLCIIASADNSSGAPVVGPLQVSGRHLAKADGTHFDFISDTPWCLLNDVTYEEAVDFIDLRLSQGFTTLQLTLLPWSWYPQVNAYSDPPFICSGCYSQPSEPFWQHQDKVLQYMESVGTL